MRYPLLFLFLSLSFPGTEAQNGQIDSLQKVLSQATSDSARVGISLELAWTYYRQTIDDSAMVYAQYVVEKGRTLGLHESEISAVQLKAFLHYAIGNIDEATRMFRHSYNLHKQYGAPINATFHYLGLINIFAEKGVMDTAILLSDSVRMVLDTTNSQQLKFYYRTMSYLFSQEEQYERAIGFSRRLIALSLQKKDTAGLLGGYYDLAADLKEMGAIDSAIFYLNFMLPIAKKVDDRFTQWQIKACLGICQIEKGDYEAGTASLLEAEPIGAEFGTELCCGNGAYLAKALIHLGRHQEAQPYILKALKQLPDIFVIRDKRNVLMALVDIYEAQKNYEKAYTTLQDLESLKDTLIHREHQKDLAELEVRYQSREQQQELNRQETQLSQQRSLIFLALLAVALLSLLAWFYRRNSLNRRRVAELLETRNEELQTLDHIKSQFFANISHEFRTPLTLILGPVEAVLKQIKDKTLRQDLETARQSSRQLLSLVEELLDLSRLEAGKVKLRPVNITLEPWLRQHFFAFESAGRIRNIEMKYESELSPQVATEIDADKLAKILNNLIGNALKFTPEGGEVVMTVDGGTVGGEGNYEPPATSYQPSSPLTPHSSLLTIEVSDTGPGIHPEELPHIFDRFYQGKKSSGGAGIGLALSQELAQIMGGTLAVNSTLGQGSTFTLSLPLVLSQVPIAETLPEEELISNTKTIPAIPAFSQQQSPYLLIVEDHPEMRDFITRILKKNFQVATAPHGKAALQQLEKQAFDLVLSDVMMPEMDGFELLETIRSQPTVFRDIPFVMLTARALTEDKLHAFQLGVDDYLIKPFQASELLARIQSLLHNKIQREKWAVDEKTIGLETIDQQLLKNAQSAVIKNLADSDFRIGDLARALTQSQRTLERTLKSITGFTPVGFIREIRLQEAYRLLQGQSFHTVSEVAQAVGISNFSYFSRSFTKRFGINPTELLRGSNIRME